MAEKRKVGRPKATAPPSKKTRRTTAADSLPSPKELTPKQEVEEEPREPTPLPDRILDSRPLPSLSELQPTTLLDEEYQSIASSATLVSSLERSRQRWLSGEFLEKYWTKTVKRKDAKVPPSSIPNNPEKSWMKEIGPCTIIVEPLILEATAYYSKEPSIVANAQQAQPSHQLQQSPAQNSAQGNQGPTTSSPYGAPYRPPGAHQTPLQPQSGSYQAQTHTPLAQHSFQTVLSGTATPPDRTLPPIKKEMGKNHSQPTPTPAVATPASAAVKPGPDPVIQLLATRASTDRDLKELMKVVATGTADQTQLKAFQKHIDELNAVIQSQKVQNSSTNLSASSNNQAHISTPQNQHPQMTPASQDHRPTPTQSRQLVQPSSHQRKNQPPPPYPVVIEFQGTSASQDRFLLPTYSIVEPLGTLSILASFLVFRKGDQAVDASLFDAETEYFEPVTVKIDVEAKYKDVLEYMKRSVKPAEEVRRWMEDKMRASKRAQTRFLPLRLPYASQIPEGEDVEDVPEVIDTRKNKNFTKKEKALEPPQENQVADAPLEGRRRSVKKSVRISEGIAT